MLAQDDAETGQGLFYVHCVSCVNKDCQGGHVTLTVILREIDFTLYSTAAETLTFTRVFYYMVNDEETGNIYLYNLIIASHASLVKCYILFML